MGGSSNEDDVGYDGGGNAGKNASSASGLDPQPNSQPNPQPASQTDYDRDLGVIEAISVVIRSCPNGGVTRAAERALEAIKAGGPDTLKEQAYFVLTAIQGWRGERARQVHRSLSRYLDPDSST